MPGAGAKIRHLRACALSVCISAIGIGGVLAGSAYAQEEQAQQPAFRDDSGTWTFVWENDSFGGTDRNYTNGVRLAYLSPTREPDAIAALIADFLSGNDSTALVRRGLAIGHSIYTPENVETAAPLPDQHPYAGYAYGEYAAVFQQNDIIDQYTIQLGVVGPSAGGEWIQTEFHDLLNASRINGWENQIGDEVGLTFAHDRQIRRVLDIGEGGLSADLTPSFGYTIGNIQTYAKVGLMARFGDDLRNDYGPPRVRPSLSGAGFFTPGDNFSWYVFAGVQGRANAHNIFLDGSLLDDGDPHVDSRTYTGDAQIGLVTQFGRAQIAYTFVHRTEEFDGQDNPQQFGAVSLSLKTR